MELTVNQMLQQGVAAHNAGNLQEAERVYQAILQSQPKHPDANHNLGLIAISVNQIAAALPLFKTALDVNPTVEQFWISYIDALVKNNQLKSAKQAIKKAKKKGFNAKHLQALISQSKAKADTKEPSQQQIGNLLEHYQNGRFGDAEKLAVSITQQFPDHQFGWKALGAVLGQTGRNSEAVNANQTAVALSPQDAEAHSNLGNTLQALGRLDEAEASYKQAIALKPDYADAHNNLGITLQALGRLEEAEASYTQAIALKPDYAEAHINLGITLQELGKLEEVEASYRHAIALEPDYVDAHSNLGNALIQLGRLDEAEASYRHAIALEPHYADAHSNLGNALIQLGRLDEAEGSLRQAILLKPDFTEAHNNLGITLQKQERLEEAEVSLRQAIALKPDYAEAHSNLSITLQGLGRLDEAQASCIRAIALKPDYAEAYSTLGVALQQLGRFNEAEESFRQSIALQSDYAEAHYNLSITLKELGRFNEAEGSVRQAILLKPDFTEAHNDLLTCLYLLDKKSLFFDQLDYLIKQDKANAVIGSFTCRSALKYGLEKQNLFCREPLKYVSHIDLNTRYEFEEIFVEKVKPILKENRISNRKQSLLVNGHQTSGNLFDIQNDFLGKIQKIIRLEIERYRINFKNCEEGLIKKWPTDYSLYGWLISMTSGGKLQPHIHTEGWLSGSVYINIPPKSQGDSGNLVVSLGEEKDAIDTRINVEKIINVVTGSFVLFPASLTHYTIPFESEEERIVLAFDVKPK